MRSEEQKLENILALMRADRAIDAPADSIRYAKNLFAVRAAQAPATLVQKIMAVLKTDIAAGELAFGERSTTGVQARQMLFEAGDNAIDIRISTNESGVDLHGQILGSGFENGELELSGTGGNFTATIDAAGDFRLTGVPAGEYDLNITNDDREITIEHITLR